MLDGIFRVIRVFRGQKKVLKAVLMRTSEAALALITRVDSTGQTEYLTQWNDAWQAYSLIGGHVEDGETFRQCCIREIEEELELQQKTEFCVSDDPIGPMYEYVAISKAAGVETQYRIELYSTEILTLAAKAKVDRNPDNCWLSETEITNKTTSAGRAIADQVGRVVNHFCNPSEALR